MMFLTAKDFTFLVWKQDHKLIWTAAFVNRYIAHLLDISTKVSTLNDKYIDTYSIYIHTHTHTYLTSCRVVCHWCELHILDLDIAALEWGSINTS